MPLNAQIALSIIAHESYSDEIARTTRVTPATYALMLTDGTNANQSQIVWSAAGTATTSTADITLSAIADTREGASVIVAFTAVKVIYIRNTSDSATLSIGGNVGAGSFGGFPITSYSILPGGCFFATAPTQAGYSVSTSPLTQARVRAASANCTYEIVIIGEGTVT